MTSSPRVSGSVFLTPGVRASTASAGARRKSPRAERLPVVSPNVVGVSTVTTEQELRDRLTVPSLEPIPPRHQPEMQGHPVPLGNPYLFESEMQLHHMKLKCRELSSEVKRLQGKLFRERRAFKEAEQREVQHAVEEEDRRRTWQMQWEKKLDQVREECAKQLAEADEKKKAEINGAMTRLGLLQSEQERREEAERAERVEVLSKRALRKMIYAGLGMAFQTWFEMWEDKVRMMNMIKQAGNRLVRPALSAAFGFWKAMREALIADAANIIAKHKEAQHEREKKDLTEELAQQKADYEFKLSQAAEQMRIALERQKVELTGSAADMMALQEEKAKEERVELLQRQITRRIMNQDINRGWSAWLEMWEAKTWAMNRLREVGNKLRSPELAEAFDFWASECDAEKQKAALDDSQSELSKEVEARKAVEEELALARQELVQKVKEAEERLRVELERQRVELIGSAAEKEAMLEEKAREERIELLRRQVARRMMNQDIIRGWSAWQEMWEAKTYAMSRLRQAAGRLHAPEKANAFAFWQEDWREEMRVQLEAAAETSGKELREAKKKAKALEEELAQIRSDLAQKVAAADDRLKKELERQRVELVGSAAEKEAMLAERSREERIELLRRQVARRMMNQDIIRGWSAWQEMWEAKTWAMNRLREVGNKLRSPELTVAFSKWIDLWIQICARNAMSEREKQEQEREAERNKMLLELEEVRLECERKLAAAQAEKLVALDRLRIELAGTAEEKLALEEAKAKEERIEQLRIKSGKRLMNAGILRGWTAWQELYEAKVYALAKLRKVAGRLMNRELAIAYGTWVQLWESLQALKELRAERQAQAVLESQLSQSKFEVGQLKMIQMAHIDEIKALKEKHSLDAAAIEKKDEALNRLKPLSQQQRKQIEQLTEELEAAQDIKWMAEGERDKARQQAAEQFTANQELMERLLKEQRATFEEEKAIVHGELEAAVALQKSIRDDYVKQLEEASDEHQALVRQARDEKEALESKLNDAVVQLRTMTGERDGLAAELAVAQENVAAGTQATAEAKDELSNVREALATAEGEIKRLEAVVAKMQAEVPKKKPPASATLGGLTLDPNGETTIAQQIAAALRARATRVLDLLREWDKDGDGEISRQEFHEAMTKMGLDAPKKDIDELFSEWDADGGGTLEFKELKDILAKSARQNLASASKKKKS